LNLRLKSWLPPGLRHMLAAAFFFSLMSLLVKAIGNRMPTAEVVLFRSVFSVIATLLLLSRRGINPWGQRRGLLLGRGLTGFVALLCFFYAIPRLPLADVTVIQFTNPVFVAIFAAVFLGEAVGRREFLSLGLSILGVLVIARPSFLTGATASALAPEIVAVAICGAILSAVAYILVRKLLETGNPRLHVTASFFCDLQINDISRCSMFDKGYNIINAGYSLSFSSNIGDGYLLKKR